MTIRPADMGDLSSIRALLRACDLPCSDLTPAHLRHFSVAQEAGTTCGVVGIEPCGDDALLRSLAVAPAQRGDGLGARLVEAAEQRARANRIGTLYLLTTTATDYFRARGYEPVGRDALPEEIQQTEEAARLCPASATAMRKSI